MKLSKAFALVHDIWLAVKAAFYPTMRTVFQSPSLLIRPAALSHLFMANIWLLFGNHVDEAGRRVKRMLLPNARGVVLDIGAGHGHTVNYLDRSKVTRYVALEPNTLMHTNIRATANAAGYSESSGTLLILPYGAEDITSILSALDDGKHLSVDTLISILTLCSVPSPERTLHALVRDVLKPGGQFLFYEHVLSHREDVAWWQRFWTPVWKTFFDGCRLDRPTHLWIERMRGEGVWKEGEMRGKPDEDGDHLFFHQFGEFIKA